MHLPLYLSICCQLILYSTSFYPSLGSKSIPNESRSFFFTNSQDKFGLLLSFWDIFQLTLLELITCSFWKFISLNFGDKWLANQYYARRYWVSYYFWTQLTWLDDLSRLVTNRCIANKGPYIINTRLLRKYNVTLERAPSLNSIALKTNFCTISIHNMPLLRKTIPRMCQL